MNPTLSIAAHALIARKGRSTLTLIGIALACTFLTAALAVARGVDRTLTTMSAQSFLAGEIIVQPGIQAPPALAKAVPLAGVLEQDDPRAALTDARVTELRALPGVTQVVPQVAFPYPVTARVDIFSMHFEIDLPLFVVDDAFFLTLGGTPPKDGERTILASQRLIDIYNLGLTSSAELPRLRKEGLVGLAFDAEVGFSSFLQQRPLGRTTVERLRIGGFTAQPTLLGATVRRSDAEAMLTALAPEAMLPTTYRAVLVFAVDDARADALATELRNSGLRATTLTDMLAGVSSGSAMLTTALAFLAGFVLLLALLTVVTTMITATIERTQEIGVLRALGAHRSDVVSQFLTEAGMLGVLGGALGLGLGVLAANSAGAVLTRTLPETSFLGSSFVAYDAVVLLAPLLAGPLVAILGALGPSIRAAHIPPVHALHTSS